MDAARPAGALTVPADPPADRPEAGDLRADRPEDGVPQARVVGRARTPGAGPQGPADTLQPLRAVRRALAAAGRKAVEVDRLAIAAPVAPDAVAGRGFARRALGPHGSGIPVTSLSVTVPEADRLAAAAVDELGRSPAGDWRVAVCVGLGTDGETVALCLARSERQAPGDEARGGAGQQQRNGPQAAG